MPDSPANQEDGSTGREQRRICDFCGETTAVLFCRADAAKLCLGCDREVHASVELFTKHTRWLLCDVCDSSPALILCATHHSVLCQNCDFELHNSGDNGSSSASAHDRRPLEGFSGRPSVSETASFFGLEGSDCKSLVEEEKGSGIWGGGFWEEEGGASDFWIGDATAPQGVVSIDELVVSSSEKHGFQAMVDLDVLPKDRNSTCGQHKREILRQLCKLAKSENASNQELESLLGGEQGLGVSDISESYRRDLGFLEAPGQEASLYVQGSKDDEAFNEAFLTDALFGNDNEEEIPSGSDRNPDGDTREPISRLRGQQPAHNVAIPPRFQTPEPNSSDRVSALLRYKEKKRNRRYEKHIRYESRKVLAESRTRIKGRFAKINQSGARTQS